MNRHRFALVMLMYAVVHAVGYWLYAHHAFALATPPEMTHSLLSAAIIVWSAEGRK